MSTSPSSSSSCGCCAVRVLLLLVLVLLHLQSRDAFTTIRAVAALGCHAPCASKISESVAQVVVSPIVADELPRDDYLSFMAGYFDAKASVRIMNTGIGLSLTFQKSTVIGGSPPTVLSFIQSQFGGKLGPQSVTKPEDEKEVWMLSFHTKTEQLPLLRELLPHLIVKRAQAEAAIDFLSCDSKLQREEKVNLGERVKELRPSAAGSIGEISGVIPTAYTAGLIHAAGCLEHEDGRIRLTTKSKWLCNVLQSAFWSACPEYEGESILCKQGKSIVISSQKCYVLLVQIREELAIPGGDDPRLAEVDTVIELYETGGQRGVAVSKEDLERRALLVGQLKGLKRTPMRALRATASDFSPPSSPPPPSRREDLIAEEAELQNELHYIEAVEQRNEAQKDSFVDAAHQWRSQSQEDRDMLLKKDSIVQRLEEIRAILFK